MAARKKKAPKRKIPARSVTEQQFQPTVVVQRQYFEGKNPLTEPEVKNETLEVRRFLTEPARVSVMMGMALNLGNYESARIDVSVALPCYREEVDAAYVYAHQWVNSRLQQEVQDVRANKPSVF